MAINKIYKAIVERLDRIEAKIGGFVGETVVAGTEEYNLAFDELKKKLVKLKGVGDSTADEIVAILQEKDEAPDTE